MRSEHAIIVGPSDGGKSTLLRQINSERERGVSVVCNHSGGEQGEPESGFSGYRAAGREAMQTACGKWDSWDDVTINLQIADPHECVRTAVRFATDVWDTAGVPCQVIVDEARHVIPEGCGGKSVNPLQWALAEGRDRGVRAVIADQNPGAMSRQELLNCRYWCYVGEYAAQMKGWLNYYEWPTDELPRQRFKYRVFDRSMELLYEGTTKEKYG